MYIYIIAIIFGALVEWLMWRSKPHQHIDIYPTEDNLGKYLYIDEKGVCYKYRMVLSEKKKI